MPYIGRPPVTGGFERQTLTANGSTTSFALDYTVSADAAILVSVGGVIQQPGSAYNLTGGGSSIAFTEAPASGVSCFIVFLGMAYDSPTFTSGSITGQTDLSAQPASDDFFLLYDTSGSGLKKVAYSNVQGEADDSVTNARLANMAANTVKVRDANSSGDPSDKAVGDTQILIGDGTGFTAAALSGDVTMANTGAVTIANTAVENAMVATGIDAVKLADGSVTNAEFQYINSVTSNVQTQLNAKAVLTTAQTFTAGQRGEVTTLSSGTTITIDMADSNNFMVTLGHNATFANPSNDTAGQSGSIFITQDGTGSRTASWGSDWDFVGGTAPTLTTTANAVDRIDYVIKDASNIHAVASLNLS